MIFEENIVVIYSFENNAWCERNDLIMQMCSSSSISMQDLCYLFINTME